MSGRVAVDALRQCRSWGASYPDTEPWSVPFLRTTELSFTQPTLLSGYISVDLFASGLFRNPWNDLEVLWFEVFLSTPRPPRRDPAPGDQLAEADAIRTRSLLEVSGDVLTGGIEVAGIDQHRRARIMEHRHMHVVSQRL